NDTLQGGAGNDDYVFAGTGLGSDSIVEVANADEDEIDLSDFGSGATLELSTTASQTVSSSNLSLTLSSNTGIEDVIGSNYGDTITGNGVKNVLVGNAGNDSLTGGLEDDVLEGGAGDDTLDGGAGNDYYVFSGTALGSDSVVETANADVDIFDF